MTPEGKTKREINKILGYFQEVWWYMPVPSGFGKQTVDYIGCAAGEFFCIEAKKAGGKPTELQAKNLADVQMAKGKTFVINGTMGYQHLHGWLKERCSYK